MNPMDTIVYNLEPQKLRAKSQRFGDVQLQETEKLVRMPVELFYCLEETVQKMGLVHLQELLAMIADKDVMGVKLELALKAKCVHWPLEAPHE